jgi:hypothetical protein
MEKALKEYMKPNLEQMIAECLDIIAILDSSIEATTLAPEKRYLEQMKGYVEQHRFELERLLASIEQVILLFELEKVNHEI